MPSRRAEPITHAGSASSGDGLPLRLRGRSALVTGAARGIGLATAQRLAQDGASVAILDIDQGAADRSADHLRQSGLQVIALCGDVRRAASIAAAVQATVDAFGRLDILVNNAGVVRDKLLEEMTDDDWDTVVDVSLRGYFVCAREAAPFLRKSGAGRIINVSSRAHRGNPGQANYSAAKAGVIGLTRALSMELGPSNVTVNAVAPGLTQTELISSHPKADAIVARAVAATPLGRVAMPGDVAAVIAFLASDDAGFVSGELIHVTGGR